MSDVPTIVFPEHVHADVRRIVSETEDHSETGVCLFGIPAGGRYIALAAVGPGPRATHTSVFYEPDVEYANAAFDALKSALPVIRWIGEFHLHPRGMTWLSGHDRETMRRLFADADLGLAIFFAGIMQRRAEGVSIYPYYFSREDQDGREATLDVVASDADIVQEARRLAIVTEAEPEGPRREPQLQEPALPCAWFERIRQRIRRKQ